MLEGILKPSSPSPLPWAGTPLMVHRDPCNVAFQVPEAHHPLENMPGSSRWELLCFFERKRSIYCLLGRNNFCFLFIPTTFPQLPLLFLSQWLFSSWIPVLLLFTCFVFQLKTHTIYISSIQIGWNIFFLCPSILLSHFFFKFFLFFPSPALISLWFQVCMFFFCRAPNCKST